MSARTAPRCGWVAPRARSGISHNPNIYLRGFGIDALLENGPPYETHAAPERLRGEPASPLSDVYSVGVVLHELLTGRPHCPGEAPASLDVLEHGAPELVAKLVMRALDPSPLSRPSLDAADWAQAFQEGFLSGLAAGTIQWMGPIVWRFPEGMP